MSKSKNKYDMKRYSKFVGKLPFSGKIAIKECLVNLYTQETLKDRLKVFSGVVLFLLLFIFAHLMQSSMGVTLFLTTDFVAVKIMALVYAAVNLMVSIEQVYLLIRSTYFIIRTRKSMRIGKSREAKTTKREVVLAVIVTLAGQIIFGGFYIYEMMW